MTKKSPTNLAEETRLRILIEQMVREGRSEQAIDRAVREAAV